MTEPPPPEAPPRGDDKPPPQKSRFWLFAGRSLGTAVFILVCGVFLYLYFSHDDDADLQVGQISQRNPAYPAGAIPYALPQKTFIVSTSTLVTGCIAAAPGSLYSELIAGTTSLKIEVDTEIDPDSRYYIYFDSGQKSKNLDFQIHDYPNGTLQALSASITDQVAPISAAIAGGLLQLLPVAVGTAEAPERIVPAPNCGQLTAAITANPNDPRLTITQQWRWAPQAGAAENGKIIEPFESDLTGLARQFGLQAPEWISPNASIEIDLPAGAAAASHISFIQGACSNNGGASACPPPLADGLILLNPASVIIRPAVCDTACVQRPAAGTGADNLTALPEASEIVPQLGTKFLIPVHSGFAQNAAIGVALDSDGGVTDLTVQSSSAFAANLNVIRPSTGPGGN